MVEPKTSKTKQIEQLNQPSEEDDKEILNFTSEDLPANYRTAIQQNECKTPEQSKNNQISDQKEEKPEKKQMPGLNELKYSFCPDDEPTDLANETLIRATNPNKIGIFSTGGLSNKIVEEIREQHSKFFEKLPFETHFETFDRAIIPVRKDDIIMDEELTEEQTVEGTRLIDSPTSGSEIVADSEIPMEEPMPDVIYDDDECIF
jgi:hypothetical protein